MVHGWFMNMHGDIFDFGRTDTRQSMQWECLYWKQCVPLNLHQHAWTVVNVGRRAQWESTLIYTPSGLQEVTTLDFLQCLYIAENYSPWATVQYKLHWW